MSSVASDSTILLLGVYNFVLTLQHHLHVYVCPLVSS